MKFEIFKDENLKNSGNKEDKKLLKYKIQEKDSKLEGDESICKLKIIFFTFVEIDIDFVLVVNIKFYRKLCRFFNIFRGCIRWNCLFVYI